MKIAPGARTRPPARYPADRFCERRSDAGGGIHGLCGKCPERITSPLSGISLQLASDYLAYRRQSAGCVVRGTVAVCDGGSALSRMARPSCGGCARSRAAGSGGQTSGCGPAGRGASAPACALPGEDERAGAGLESCCCDCGRTAVCLCRVVRPGWKLFRRGRTEDPGRIAGHCARDSALRWPPLRRPSALDDSNYGRLSTGLQWEGYSGPMYSARGRIRRLSSSCSITWAAHPAMRLTAKMGV